MSAVNGNRIFEARDLGYIYPGDIVALCHLNFTIGPGEMVALMGANGSGKSTLLKIMDGLIFPTEGEMVALQRPLSENVLRDKGFASEFRKTVGLVFQDTDAQLFSPTVWDEITFGPLQLDIPREEVAVRSLEVLELLDIAHLRNRAPYLLSGGEKRKVSLASVLSIHPRVLLLDEPTDSLDPRSQGKLIDFLLKWSDNEKSLVFSTQDIDIAEEIATRVIVFGSDHSIIADGEPEKLLKDPDFLLRTNLVHEHSHRHKSLVHSHPHQHDHHHTV